MNYDKGYSSLAIALFFATSFLGFRSDLYAQCTGTVITSFTVTSQTNVSCFGGNNAALTTQE